ncbi:hypothetical protein ATANTOWER_018824 [Ataeniobius toweri]|uniref:EF-hand domain-containing protein n=1 Tax=Ataeniobius toweri TaxID=208326 RepID=A0ABU7CIA6_9TELE|nr:hypothetical protein [Ataeniobius toweri]
MLRRNLLEAIRMACNDQKEAPKYNQRKKKNYKIELTDAQIWELRRDFEAFESARTGPIEVKELQVAIKHLGLEPTEELIRMVANQDPSGVIYFNDFLHVAAQEMKKENTTEEQKKVFQMFDNDSTGKISLQNLQRVAKELGQNITNEELKVMWILMAL